MFFKKYLTPFALGHALNDMCACMWFTYGLMFFNKVLQFDNFYSGVLLLIGQLADGLSTILVGMFANKSSSSFLCARLGQRKAWHLIGCLCVLISFPFIFTQCLGCSNAEEYVQFMYFAFFIIVFQFGWAATENSHLATISDLAENQSSRTRLSAVRYAMTVLANVVVYLSAWAFFGKNRNEEMIRQEDAYSFRNLMLVCIGVGSLTSLGYQTLLKIDGNKKPEIHQKTTTIKSLFKWFKDAQLYQMALIYMTTRLFVNLSQMYIPLYLQVTLELPAVYIATIPLTIFLSGFVTSFAMKKINQILGGKVTFIIGSLIGIAGCFWIELGCDPHDENLVYYLYGIAALVGMGGSTMLVTSVSLTAKFIGDNSEASAFIYGFMSLTDKVACGLAVVLIQHYTPLDMKSCVLCRDFYKHTLLYTCGGIGLFGILVTMTLLPFKVGAKHEKKKISTLNIIAVE